MPTLDVVRHRRSIRWRLSGDSHNFGLHMALVVAYLIDLS